MRAVLQIFCALSVIARIGDSCLSNPNLRCSPTHYSSQSSPCKQADYSGSTVYKTGQYNGFLGQDVYARAYAGNGKQKDFAKEDLDLRCHDDESCKWRNEPKDELDWVVGAGKIDPPKLALITGSNIFPDPWFLILASDPRPNHQGGALISPPIGCQQSSGLLSFRLWKSRSRERMIEPNLDICTRKIPEENLENCLMVNLTNTENQTIIASIPPQLQPFEIVLRGHDFSNEPEGGLLIMDQIDYFAHVDTPENCIGRQLDNEKDYEIDANETNIQDDDELLTFSMVNTSTVTLPSISDQKPDWCSVIPCDFDMKPPCGYTTIGRGALGDGYDKGWKIITVPSNIANRLTGIHVPPGSKESIEQEKADENPFFVAEFPGFNRTRREHKFVLEAPEFEGPLGTRAWLGFQKYLATQGIEIAVCEDINMKACFWDNFLQSAEPFARSWTNEIVELPENINKFFIVATQDVSIRANNGQVGIAGLTLFGDPEGKRKFC
ncbi:unnamed protein product, partial [Mesorhabditis belari]|uniref:MAM domain-containing protein n=1 Tax=Mesorhabditis belari TaxID=2138241 RepID=A0AAF3ETK5_9BILA